MRVSLGLICVICIVNKIDCDVFSLRSKVDFRTQELAVKGLIVRLFGNETASKFNIHVESSLFNHRRDSFEIASVVNEDKVNLTGSSGVAVASGLYYYLSRFCNCQITWGGIQCTIPVQLPKILDRIQIVANDLFRYYQNVCTVSYSFVWWDWERWEKEIDWMALHGINMPLAFNSQEEIWRRVYLKLGFQQRHLDEYFTGPAFFAWNRMANVDGWGGPLPLSWHKKQLVLQHKILKRMRNFGMLPILPAFSGHVPKGIKEVFPNASVTRLDDWCDFGEPYCCTALLNLTSPLFQIIGNAFMKELITEFGTDNLYNTDTFNEMTPPSNEPSYLKQAGEAVYSAMALVDPKAVWVMQGWIFCNNPGFWKQPQAKALLTSVPIGSMIVLDLQSEYWEKYSSFDSYYGQPFIWNMLHNFGGTNGLFGIMDESAFGPYKARNFPNSSMIGVGLTPEGIEQNEVLYELVMNAGFWYKNNFNVDTWLMEYITRRYGPAEQTGSSQTIHKAWKRLRSTVYNATTGHGGYIITKRPRLGAKPLIWYDPNEFMRAWDGFLKSTTFYNNTLFKYDLVDVTREALRIIAMQTYVNMTAAFDRKDQDNFTIHSKNFMDILNDIERLLASDKHFLLGNWLESAKRNGLSKNEIKQMEYNARNQLTLWGPKGEILDYAAKQWSGLFSEYYIPRWQLFVHTLQDCLTNNSHFDKNAFDQKVFLDVEEKFTFMNTSWPEIETGNSFAIVKELYSKWRFTGSYLADLTNLYEDYLGKELFYLSDEYKLDSVINRNKYEY